ncbi:sensor histidine kinase [Nocardia flavorosea]|uniref:sensor histidine kinase n=1 Tax=Nocardia flavorosea TaxID=53429 RepID=UPI0024588569|nr:ATP-binding protein [Nocardia flavorosea]
MASDVRSMAIATAAISLAVFAGLTAPHAGMLPLSTVVMVAMALVVLVWPPPGCSRVAVAVAAFGVSLGVTAALPAVPPPPMRNAAGLCLLLESVAAAALLVGLVRRVRVPAAVTAGVLGVVALTTVPLRVAVDSSVPPDALEVLVLCLLGALPAVAAVMAGGYLRALDHRRARAVFETRLEQRLELARDLHDLLGHDLNEIVLEAQAAQLLPEAAERALARIEQIGVAALTSMDHTVRMLHDPGTGPLTLPGDLSDLPDLVSRFSSQDAPTVSLDSPPGVVEAVPREIGTLAYRIVVESLTNVRRHARNARTVSISVRPASPTELAVTVVDDGTGVSSEGTGRRGNGLGLLGLTERTAAVGGTLLAGPRSGPSGWQVHAVLPIS